MSSSSLDSSSDGIQYTLESSSPQNPKIFVTKMENEKKGIQEKKKERKRQNSWKRVIARADQTPRKKTRKKRNKFMEYGNS
jgi:hypothetical protein